MLETMYHFHLTSHLYNTLCYVSDIKSREKFWKFGLQLDKIENVQMLGMYDWHAIEKRLGFISQ